MKLLVFCTCFFLAFGSRRIVSSNDERRLFQITNGAGVKNLLLLVHEANGTKEIHRHGIGNKSGRPTATQSPALNWAWGLYASGKAQVLQYGSQALKDGREQLISFGLGAIRDIVPHWGPANEDIVAIHFRLARGYLCTAAESMVREFVPAAHKLLTVAHIVYDWLDYCLHDDGEDWASKWSARMDILHTRDNLWVNRYYSKEVIAKILSKFVSRETACEWAESFLWRVKTRMCSLWQHLKQHFQREVPSLNTMHSVINAYYARKHYVRAFELSESREFYYNRDMLSALGTSYAELNREITEDKQLDESTLLTEPDVCLSYKPEIQYTPPMQDFESRLNNTSNGSNQPVLYIPELYPGTGKPYQSPQALFLRQQSSPIPGKDLRQWCQGETASMSATCWRINLFVGRQWERVRAFCTEERYKQYPSLRESCHNFWSGWPCEKCFSEVFCGYR